MLAKCANPSCSAPFHYMRDGKLFQIAADDRRLMPVNDLGTGPKKPPRSVEFFWLCGDCCKKFTIRVDGIRGVHTVPLLSETLLRVPAV